MQFNTSFNHSQTFTSFIAGMEIRLAKKFNFSLDTDDYPTTCASTTYYLKIGDKKRVEMTGEDLHQWVKAQIMPLVPDFVAINQVDSIASDIVDKFNHMWVWNDARNLRDSGMMVTVFNTALLLVGIFNLFTGRLATGLACVVCMPIITALILGLNAWRDYQTAIR